MKKNVGRSVYNSDTARKIGTWDNGRFGKDYARCEETLYQTKAGKYFIHGKGGKNSRYAVWVGNVGLAGEDIRAYSLEDAAAWAEEHLPKDLYLLEFGEVSEGVTERVTVTVTLPLHIKVALERRRAKTGRSVSKMIEELIIKHISEL